MDNIADIIIKNTGAFVCVIDLQNYEILYANDRCIKEFGNIVGKTCYKTIQKNEESPCSFCPLHKENREPLSYPFGTTFEWENKNSINGRYYFFNDCIVDWSDGKKAKIQIGIDITKQKKLEEKVVELANYDSLTNLANRRLLKKAILNATEKSTRTSYYNALLFLDLDNFKTINDKYGHSIGDKLLIEVSKRIKHSLRKQDMTARLGGDEFVVLIETREKDESMAVKMFAKISQNILTNLKSVYAIDNYECNISASIGIKLFKDHSASVDELIVHADNAMYNAKENGRNTFCFFEAKLEKIIQDKIKLTDSLKRAIDNNLMSLYYQTQIFSNKKETIVGVEALVRWVEPKKGVILPSQFISIAEDSGLIIPLGEWIFDEVCKQINRWRDDEVKKRWIVSVNISSKQFEKDDFLATIAKIINKNSVNPKMLRLELNESLLLKNTDRVLDTLHKLKDMGFSLSIDDFGTGYSSLSYLKKLPIDELKIDQSFIRDLCIDKNDEIITQTIIDIGKKFSLEVIAEGVETQEQYKKLLDMGCNYFQGYFFSKPISVEKL